MEKRANVRIIPPGLRPLPIICLFVGHHPGHRIHPVPAASLLCVVRLLFLFGAFFQRNKFFRSCHRTGLLSCNAKPPNERMTMGGCIVLILIKKRKEREFNTRETSGWFLPRSVIIIRPPHTVVVKELQTICESFVNTACISTAIVHPPAIPLPSYSSGFPPTPARYVRNSLDEWPEQFPSWGAFPFLRSVHRAKSVSAAPVPPAARCPRPPGTPPSTRPPDSAGG